MKYPTSTTPVNTSCAAPDALFIVRKLVSYPDICDSLHRLVAEGTLRGASVIEIDPVAAAGPDPWTYVRQHVQARETELVVLHHFHSTALPDLRPAIQQLKSHHPSPTIAITNGDPFYNGLRRPSLPRMLREASQAVDVTFSTSMGVIANRLVDCGARRVALLPHGVCQARFGEARATPRHRKDFDVVFIGSNNRPRNFLRNYHWYARRRGNLIRKLSARFGSGLGVFGHGWTGIDGWQGPVAFAEQQAVCQRARLVVGGVPFSSARYYLSDRPFIQIASGVPFVDIAVEGVGTILRDGEHWHLATTMDDVIDLCDDLLCRPSAEAEEMGSAAADFVLSKHTVADRCRSLIASLRSLHDSVAVRSPVPPPDLRFLLPEIVVEEELPLATRLWSNDSART